MSTPSPPQPQQPAADPADAKPPQDLKNSGTPDWLHNSAIAVAVLGPIGLLMPPRRASFQSVILAGGTFWATNQLAFDWTGKSIQQRFAARFEALADTSLPEQARRTQEAMRAERRRREAAMPEEERQAAEVARRRREQEAQGPLGRLWYGGKTEREWTEERSRKEKEALEDGRGYQGLILDQISEVWGQIRGKGNAADDADTKKPGNDERKS